MATNMRAIKCSNPDCCSNNDEPDNRYFNFTVTVDATLDTCENIARQDASLFECIHCGFEAMDEEDDDEDDKGDDA